MATKRVTKTAIDWSRLQKLLPTEQQYIYTSLLAKNYQYSLKIANLNDSLPKIDFEAYKKQLANPAAIEKLEKGYLALKIDFPKDSENLLSKVNQAEKDEDARISAYLKEISQTIEKLKTEKVKLTNVPPLEEMTKELEVYYFPEKAEQYKEYLGEVDAYAKMIEASKKGHHHH